MPEFRWQGKYLFLTYPQSDFNLDGAVHRLREQGGRHVTFVRVCSEQHQSGELHRHALLCFGKRVSFTDQRRFDIDGRHPKWERYTRSPAKAAEYIAKEGEYVDWGETPDFSTPECRESRNELWGRLLDEATTPESFMSLVRQFAPYDFATRYQALHTMATSVFHRRSPHQSPHDMVEDFQLPDTIERWLEEEFDQENRPIRPKSLLIVGDSRSGKTSFARCLGHHIYFQGLFNLDKFDPQADYAVFDDCKIKWISNHKSWLGCGGEFEATDKYRTKRTLSWSGKPSIICCNRGSTWDWRYSEEWKDDPGWFEANVVVCELGPNQQLWEVPN
ncbi:replication associated protein [Termite associated circular virus 4]|uniref:replication associated protein n=1 Tax=Termite associated circular virus 4 TaxID=2108552 RepID=UPI000D205B94|nr:replication associated protein [Termite associated circular virus 4]AVK87315.1 replication associated protein [Termite associated circular virus 4]